MRAQTLDRTGLAVRGGCLRAGALFAVAAALVGPPSAAQAANARSFNCPPVVQAQYSRLSAFGPDGAEGSVEGLTPLFFPRTPLRLVSAQLARAHGGEEVPSDLLPPDGLVIVPGRPMTWTLWNGEPPAPVAIAHVVCEYEGGLMLHRAIGADVRRCALETQLQRASRHGGAKRTTDDDDEAVRPVVTRAVFSCS